MITNVNKINQNNNYGIGNERVDLEWSALKLSNTVAGTGDMGLLMPIFTRELIPSQSVNVSQDVAIQFMPFVSDLFHQIDGSIITAFVPNRIMWDDWETFITGGLDGLDATAHPTLDLNTLYTAAPSNELLGTVIDYLGWPISDEAADTAALAGAIKPSAFPVRTYNKIWNDIIRNPDITNTEIGEDQITLKRGYWDFDYFTRSRIYQERGAIPTIGLDESIASLTHEIQVGDWDSPTGSVWTEVSRTDNGMAYLDAADADRGVVVLSDTNDDTTGSQAASVTNHQMRWMPHDPDEIYINMNDWLNAWAIMKYQTTNARIEPRYVSWLQARFGVYPQDSRLDRAEYINTNYFNIQTEPVVQTGYGDPSGGETAQGNITGQATGRGNNLSFSYEAKEHGIIMSLLIIKPKPVYEGGLNRMWVRETKWDYPTPEFANLPDIEVLESELLYRPDETENETVFGYQGIYEEDRTMWNEVVGLFRPSEAAGLGSHTLARYWTGAGRPTLNEDFMECNPDQDRILQFTDEPCFKYFVRNDMRTSIPLPIQSNPGTMLLPR